jgi:hypothetical protein
MASMHDRLKSVKASRNVRNISLCLSLAFFLEFIILFYNWLMQGHNFLIQAVVFLTLSAVSGYLAFHFHQRFRNRD